MLKDKISLALMALLLTLSISGMVASTTETLSEATITEQKPPAPDCRYPPCS